MHGVQNASELQTKRLRTIKDLNIFKVLGVPSRLVDFKCATEQKSNTFYTQNLSSKNVYQFCGLIRIISLRWRFRVM